MFGGSLAENGDVELPSMDNFTRCSDTNDTLDGFKLSKGKGVVSILWSTAWTNNIKMLDETRYSFSVLLYYR
jgi:hypothetical protein